MPLVGTPLRLTPEAGVGAGNWAFKAAGTTANTNTRADFGTSTTYRYLQAIPGTTTSGAGTALPTNTATGRGWNILPADMDEVAPARRVIPAGTWTGNFTWVGTADPTGTQFGIRIHFYRRTTSGSYVFIASGEVINATPPAVAGVINVPVTVGSDQLFEVGETLHMEVWFRGRGQTVGQILQFHVNASGSSTSQLTLPNQGLRTNHPRSHSVSRAATVAMAKLPRKNFALTAATTLGLNRLVRTSRASVSTVATPTMARRVTAVRQYAVTAGTTSRLRVDMPESVLDRMVAGGGGPTDYSPNNGAKAVAGVIRDRQGNPVSGATVRLFRQSDDFMAQSQVTGADGTYSFPRDSGDPNSYYVVVYKVNEGGLTRRDLVPV